MADPFYGEIRAFAFTFPPQDWAYCNGASVSIGQNPVLNAVIGATYGGDGKTYFKLPNLMTLAPLGSGTGPGLTPRLLGKVVGETSVTLQFPPQIPSHNHGVNILIPPSSTEPTNTGTPGATVQPAQEFTQSVIYTNASPTTTLATTAISTAPAPTTPPSSITPHENRQPFLVLNFCICLLGEYPMRAD